MYLPPYAAFLNLLENDREAIGKIQFGEFAEKHRDFGYAAVSGITNRARS
jgi:hypothetical protein